MRIRASLSRALSATERAVQRRRRVRGRPNPSEGLRTPENRRLERFEKQCDRLGIPEDVRARIRKTGDLTPPDWYAGRQQCRD